MIQGTSTVYKMVAVKIIDTVVGRDVQSSWTMLTKLLKLSTWLVV
jgi:hypothetical protein